MSASAAVVAAGTTATSIVLGLPPVSAFIAGIAGAALYQSFSCSIGGIRTILQALMCAIVACILAPFVGHFLDVADDLRTASITAGLAFILNLCTPSVIEHAPGLIKSLIEKIGARL